jgi:nucleoside-diphosphate-sugar epimerase
MTGTNEIAGPLILGASGRVGGALRRVAAAGLWPGVQPVWHARSGEADVTFDLLGRVPALPRVQGVVVLAGVTSGSDGELALNTDLALAGIALARERGLGRVLVLSSAGVYGPAQGPRAESDPMLPGTPYGRAKRAMEGTVSGLGATCLRLANVAGCDALFASALRGRVRLDRFPDGSGPSRAYAGPVTLARVLDALLRHEGELPSVLNVASPNPLSMEEVLVAMGVPFDWAPAPPGALHRLALDTSLLSGIVDLPELTPDALVAEARAGGWGVA